MNLPNEKFPLKILIFLENKHTVGGLCRVCEGEKRPNPVGGSGGILPRETFLNIYVNGANVKYFERIKARIIYISIYKEILYSYITYKYVKIC